MVGSGDQGAGNCAGWSDGAPAAMRKDSVLPAIKGFWGSNGHAKGLETDNKARGRGRPSDRLMAHRSSRMEGLKL